MPIEAFSKQNCAIAQTLAFLGERWTILVLRELFLGRRRFDEIETRLGIAPNILSARLKTLEREGVVRRRPYGDRRDRFEYLLTDKGRELQPVLLELLTWGDRHKLDSPPLLVIHTACGHPMHPVQTCSRCGGELNGGNVEPRVGPGATRVQRQLDAGAR